MKEHPPQKNCPTCGLRVQTIFEHVDAEARSDSCPVGVVAAAILDPEGKPVSLPPPARHGHIIRYMAEELHHKTPISGEQGFMLSDGRFARRKPAGRIAIKAGQIRELSHPSLLYSEDLW
jgi:hypothetical protein